MTHTTLLLLSPLALVAAFLVGVTVYVAGSYLLMVAHTEPKPWGRLLREAATELWWTARTQPLLPLYYLIGRSFGGEGGRRPVVFVHGYAQNRVGFIGLARELRRRGFGPLYGFNYPWFLSITANARRLGRFVDEVMKASPNGQIDLVCHSMGGLVALEYLRQAGTSAPVRCCATIASPHAGVAFKGPIPGLCGPEMRSEGEYLRELAKVGLTIKVLSIFSTHDNVVHPPTTSMLASRGGTDLSIDGGGHFALLFDPKVIDSVASFLSEGEKAPAHQGQVEVESVSMAEPRALPEHHDEDAEVEGEREEQGATVAARG